MKYLDKELVNKASVGDLTIVKYLIEDGADVNAMNGMALMYACNYNHLDVVKVLIEAGSDIHAQEDKALIVASEWGLSLIHI